MEYIKQRKTGAYWSKLAENLHLSKKNMYLCPMKEAYLHNGETLLAGKPLFLPMEQVTVVMQCLTSEQIAAIPADWFSVEVIKEEKLV